MEQTTRKKSKKKSNKIAYILCVIIGVLVGLLVGMVLFGKDKTESNDAEAEDTTVKSSKQEMLETEDPYLVETPYGSLYFPEKWAEQVLIEPVEGDVYTVKFSAVFEGKEVQPIFDVAFGGENGYTLGTLKTEDGEISVNLISYELAFDETWTEEEKTIVYAMQEDCNYLIAMLEQEENFELNK